MADKRAKPFKVARQNRLNEKAEDYTELIQDLLVDQKQVRVCDIAKKMGISHVSVLKAVHRLLRDEYITKSADCGIALTEKGKRTAEFSKRRHEILSKFLLTLGIPDDIAAADVEGIEHHISNVTLEAIATFLSEDSRSRSVSDFSLKKL